MDEHEQAYCHSKCQTDHINSREEPVPEHVSHCSLNVTEEHEEAFRGGFAITMPFLENTLEYKREAFTMRQCSFKEETVREWTEP
jgi:hypothetical protein